RPDMVKRLRSLGLLVKEEPLRHAVGVHDRCDTVDEPLVMKQWWMRMPPLARPAIEAVRDGRVRIIPKHQEAVFFNWMENIRDWSIARQIWWGHPIPAWYCRDCQQVVVPEEDAPDPTRCPACASSDIRQDPDVLDTWFSSALWPHSTLGWPDRTRDLERYYPGSVLETGYDILFFWVARMIMMGLENMGDVPFHTVYVHGLVRTGGEKMSKSRGNVISPVGLIEEHGADALRFALVSGVAAGADSQLAEAKLVNARNFANKLWNVGRFVLRQIDARPAALRGAPIDRPPAGAPGEAERWILSRTAAIVEEASRLLETYLFSEYVALLQSFVWGELADTYLELAKPGLRDGARADGVVRTLAHVLDRALRLLHPIMPFVTETLALQLWRRGGLADVTPSLVVASWPTPRARDRSLEERFTLALDVVRAIRGLRQDAGLAPTQRVQVSLAGEVGALRERLADIAALSNADVVVGPGRGSFAVVGKTEVHVSTIGHADAAARFTLTTREAEAARLNAELAEARDALRRSLEVLAQPGFADRAPQPVIEKERDRRAQREERLRLLEEQIRLLSNSPDR
ncbi:MAG: class I tRNA ligase family protein, partial [Candidatus Limnocylindria bacterium]